MKDDPRDANERLDRILDPENYEPVFKIKHLVAIIVLIVAMVTVRLVVM